jgi:hypothetical protein
MEEMIMEGDDQETAVATAADKDELESNTLILENQQIVTDALTYFE